jgi:acetyl-CoA carboxylase carboxyltransferase component
MTWQKEVDEIKKRHDLAEKMGGEEGIARQHKRGKLTIRERIATLVDLDSFQQWGKLSGFATYNENNELVDFIPSASVMGLCTINGRRVFLTGQDFTVRGGSGEATGAGIDAGHNHPSPVDLRLPTVNLVDGAGGSVTGFEKLGRTYIPDGAFFGPMSEILTIAPVVSAILGPAAGGLAPMPCLCHFSVIVKGTGQVFPGGPPVVKAARASAGLSTMWPIPKRKPLNRFGGSSVTCRTMYGKCRHGWSPPMIPSAGTRDFSLLYPGINANAMTPM